MNEKPLQASVKRLFPGHVIKFNVRKDAGMATPASHDSKITVYWELDVWIPSLNLGFEYQVYFFSLVYYFNFTDKYTCRRMPITM